MIPGLTPSQLLDVWDAGQRLGPLDRAVLLAGAALHERDGDEIADLAIGARDAAILRLRQATVGDRLTAAVLCPACSTSCELYVSVQALLDQDRPEGEEGAPHAAFRLPSSRDLAAAVSGAASDPEAVLVRRCLLAPAGAAGAETAVRLAQWVGRHDPLAEIQLGLSCHACGHAWSEILEPAAFFWQEIDGHARALLESVDRLARAYGWSESEVLALSHQRRAVYLELAR